MGAAIRNPGNVEKAHENQPLVPPPGRRRGNLRPLRQNAPRPLPKHGADERIARALEAIAAHLSAASPAPEAADPFDSADAFVWHPNGRLAPVPRVSRVDLGLLKGIDRMRDILIENTERFADGLPANNALLWGARGMGKSSLVKAAHASINANRKPADRLKLIEIHREDIESLPELDGAVARLAVSVSSCSATICRSTATTPPTNRSRRCWKAASRAVPTT